uniref:N-acetyltransferase domain-containing protein n=1 Tax=Kryptolebias marmoratus TaxID=37003 RepID=A0A3Q2ZZR7_KRYMA
MANIPIRKYHNYDVKSVQEIFTEGMNEHLPSSFMHVLKQPLTRWSPSPSAHPDRHPPPGWSLVDDCMFKNIEASLKNDLSVSETYLRKKDSCFWVAEHDRRGVGTVDCLSTEKCYLIINSAITHLKRMSVCHSHRWMGIAKALCRKIEDFTCDRGYPLSSCTLLWL